MTFLRVDVAQYRENKRGPSTEPCRTPVDSLMRRRGSFLSDRFKSEQQQTTLTFIEFHLINSCCVPQNNNNNTGLKCISEKKDKRVKVQSHLSLFDKFSLAQSSHLRIFSHTYFVTGFKLVIRICHFDQQKPAWFESNFCMSCDLYISALLTKYNEPFFAHKNLHVPAEYVTK